MPADFNSWLGMEVGSDGNLVLDPRPEHRIGPDMLHFAVLTTLSEVAAARAVGESVVPTTVTVHLLRPAKAERLVAKGQLLRKGRRLCVAEGAVFQDERLVAKATVQFARIA